MVTAFGTQFMPEMAISWFNGEHWSQPEMVSSDSLPMHPASHVLHYASTCFEGLKAFRHQDGSVNIFRMDKNIKRFAQSSRLLVLPEIDEEMVAKMIIDLVGQFKEQTPQAPGSMYIRPTHIGTEASIGKAAAPSSTSCLFILLSPVGDYFQAGEVALRLLLDDVGMRCAPDNGMIKSGGNYASALKHIIKAKESHNADQVLFCPQGDVQETGAANFILIDGNELITKPLDDSFLHGVTRNSILTLAADQGMVVSERSFSVAELIEWASKPGSEAALSGTAAGLTSVGTLIYQDKETQVGSGKPGEKVASLKRALNDIQWGRSADNRGWLTQV